MSANPGKVGMYDGIIAPRVIDGSINGERFRTYVEQALVPELRPDDIVVRDHLGSHKTPPSARQARSFSTCRLFARPQPH